MEWIEPVHRIQAVWLRVSVHFLLRNHCAFSVFPRRLAVNTVRRIQAVWLRVSVHFLLRNRCAFSVFPRRLAVNTISGHEHDRV